jgi:membrane-associated phospholipid phosphatase
MTHRSLTSAQVSRRTLVGTTLAGAALAPLATRSFAATHQTAATPTTETTTPSAEGWRMWILESASEVRPEPPGEPTEAEIEEVVQAQAAVSDEQAAAIRKWSGGGFTTFPWTSAAFPLFPEFSVGGMPQGRFMSIYSTALHDAEVAAWDAQLAIARPSPAATDERIVPAAGVDPTQPSFPSRHAAVAAAAAAVLAYLLPDAETGRFDAMVTEATESRIAAGAAFRSDIDAGLALGQAVAERAIARAMADGSDQVWDPATRLTGPGTWQPAPPDFIDTPVAPMAGSWKPWVMTSNDQFRPLPPPEHGSPEWQMELETVQHTINNLTFDQRRLAIWWAGMSPLVLFSTWAQELCARAGKTSPEAAQIIADTHVAMDDAVLAVWDAKYTWWTSRPITEDPDLAIPVPTPPYPSYPSGYSTYMGAGATVLGYYFPAASGDLDARAFEAACSRLWAGIHYAFDNDTGLAMGRLVGRLVTSLAHNHDAS